MSHRAGLYTVEVHPRREPGNRLQLGDLDGRGTWLADLLRDYLSGAEIADADRRLRCLSVSISNGELLGLFEHGLGGVDAVIKDRDGAPKAYQEMSDSQYVECGSLFRLPANDTMGWLAIHSPGGRGVKSLLVPYIRKTFKKKFPALVVEMTPYVPESVLREAVREHAIQEIRLVKRVRPSDLAVFGVDQWVDERAFGKIELTIKSKLAGEVQHLLTRPLERFLDHEDGARESIVQFKGIEFDEAKVLVDEGDRTRTYNIEQPGVGHPMTVRMDLGPGKPSPEAIFDGLRLALGDVGS